MPAGAQPLPDLPVRSLEQLSTAPRPATQPVAPAAAGGGLDGPQTLSVSLTHPTSLVTVLQLLFRGTAFNTVVQNSLPGTFSGELRNVTLRQALEAVLFPSGLGYDVRGTVIRVFPRTTTRRDSQEGRR